MSKRIQKQRCSYHLMTVTGLLLAALLVMGSQSLSNLGQLKAIASETAEAIEVPKAGAVTEKTKTPVATNTPAAPENKTPEAKPVAALVTPSTTTPSTVTPAASTTTIPTTTPATTTPATTPATTITPAPALTLTPAKNASTTPKIEVWRGFLKGFSYSFIEIENATPYVYMPNSRGDFQSDLNNIKNNREGGNIIVIANASLYNTTTTDPLGTTIQNGKILSRAEKSDDSLRTLVVDEKGNVGYAKDATNGQISSYIDARTGQTVTGRKIVSAVYGFGPVRLNNKKATEYSKIASNYRARQMFCVKQNSYMIISNTGEGENGGGWNFDDMAKVAEYRGCISAFSLDGGGSTATAYRTLPNGNFSVLATTIRHDPTFIVFTSDNLAPRGK